MPYRRTRRAVLMAATLCDLLQVDAPHELPGEVVHAHPELQWLEEVGSLKRTSFSPGIVLLPEVATRS